MSGILTDILHQNWVPIVVIIPTHSVDPVFSSNLSGSFVRMMLPDLIYLPRLLFYFLILDRDHYFGIWSYILYGD